VLLVDLLGIPVRVVAVGDPSAPGHIHCIHKDVKLDIAASVFLTFGELFEILVQDVPGFIVAG
jgi:hypothetical protein